MARLASNAAETRHVAEVRDQLVEALGAGGSRLAVILHSGRVVIGTLRGNSAGGDFPHYFGSLQLLPDVGQEGEIDFLNIKLIDRA